MLKLKTDVRKLRLQYAFQIGIPGAERNFYGVLAVVRLFQAAACSSVTPISRKATAF